MRLCTLILILIGLLWGCGSKQHDAKPAPPLDSALLSVAATYRGLAPHGWDAFKACDALLFVSLQQIGLGEDAYVTEAEGTPGRWFRLPGLAADSSLCDSDVSRDMFHGLFLYALKFRRLDIVERIWDYGVANDWVMGGERAKTVQNRVVFMPAHIGLLAKIIYHLGGADHPERLIAPIYDTTPGFTSHLTLMFIQAEGEISGSLDDKQITTIRKILQTMDGNPYPHALLHKYTDGDQTTATQLLLGLWPQDRLPTTNDWCEAWRTQRADGDSGLQPCSKSPPDVHPGGDLLFVVDLMTR